MMKIPAFLVLLAMTLLGQVAAIPLGPKVHPRPHDFSITTNTTINSTSTHHSAKPVAANAPPSPLSLAFVNNLSGSAGDINAYLTGLDGDGAAFFLQSDGTPYYPPNPAAGIPPTPIAQDVAIPLGAVGDTINISLPNYISSGRIYFSVGTMSFGLNNGPVGPEVVAPSFTNSQDPNADTDYGFVEFTWTEDGGIYSNLSYVDFIGLVISQVLSTLSNGACEVKGLPANAVSTVCSGLEAQAAQDGQPWGQSCQADTNGNPLRVLAPLHLTEVDSGALATYYDDYINQVWTHYSTQDLTITAGSLGNFTGSVDSSGMMNFNQGGSFAKPVITDILGCNSGPFANPTGTDAESTARKAIVARLCAAFDRSTLLLPGGDVQPDGISDPSLYYPTGVATNVYSRLVHQHELDGKGYAFAYDDVTPDGAPDVSGLCTDPNPTLVTFTVGGFTS